MSGRYSMSRHGTIEKDRCDLCGKEKRVLILVADDPWHATGVCQECAAEAFARDVAEPGWKMTADAAMVRSDGKVCVDARVMMEGGPLMWTAKRMRDGKPAEAIRDVRKRIRFFSTRQEAAEYADTYSPMGVDDRETRAVEIEPAVHILWEGLPLCRFTHKVPKEWPDGHSWVSKAEFKEDTYGGEAICEECIAELEDEERRS